MTILLLLFVGFVLCDFSKCHNNNEMVGMFEEFALKHEKLYEDEKESDKRYLTFCKNVLFVEQMKKEAENNGDWDADWMGVTQFMDLEEHEFREKYLMQPSPSLTSESSCPLDKKGIRKELEYEFGSVTDIPDTWDWSEHGAVTDVKNQRLCSSCWAFSATGNMEGQWYLSKNQLLSFSEQQIVNCCETAHGCLTGFMTDAFEYVIEAGGIESEEVYPYKGFLEWSCKFNKSLVVANFSSYHDLPDNETQMLEWCYSNGPISVGLDAMLLMFYIGGVYDPPKLLCPGKILDHGVLIVGWGTHDGIFGKKDYWLVKNSWGKHWGEKGYFKIKRGDGKCGINRCALTIVV